MITLYHFPSPNGRKALIALEEFGLPYRVERVDVMIGEQFKPEFLAINPLGKVPALIDAEDGAPAQRVFGSGAILLYLAEKTGRLMPTDPVQRAEALSWLELAISDLSPAAMNLFRFFARAPEKLPYAIDLFKCELGRCWKAFNGRLADHPYLAGDDFSIADIAAFPFAAAKAKSAPGYFMEFPDLLRWHDRINDRPAVQRAMAWDA
ncbi:MAG: glutathione S-transferase N-terminal domain-containing protein [Azospirillaceae bacterium]|nr:glutathione S-transferase N-terminal domain-containing protein [Azospirillaceae bacterium]